MSEPEDVEADYLFAPRIEVIIAWNEACPDRTDDGSNGPYDLYIVLHVSDEKHSSAVLFEGGPWDRNEAGYMIQDIFTTLGEKYAPSRMVGARGLMDPPRGRERGE